MAGWKFYIDNIKVAEPIGWDAIEFIANRMDSHGIDQPFTTEISFIGKGAKILKSYFDSGFINDSIPFRITSDQKIDGQKYDFNGFINMAIYSEKNTCDTQGWEITVGILEDDFRENFLARQDVDIDLTSELDLDQNPIDPIDFRTIRLHCQELLLVANAKNYSVQGANMDYNTSGWDLDDFAVLLPAYFSNSDFKGVFGNTFNPVSTKYTTASPIFVNNSDFPRTINIKSAANGFFDWNSFPIATGDSANITLSIQVKNSLDVETQRLYLYDSGICFFGGSPVDWDYNIQQDVITNPGDRVYIFMQWGSLGSIKVGVTPVPNANKSLIYACENLCLTITELNSSATASTCQLLTIEDFVRRVIHIITGDPDGLISDSFSESDAGCFWNYALTSGLYIRNARTIQQIIDGCGNIEDGTLLSLKTTFKKLFEGLNPIFCLGWAFEQNIYGDWKIRIEKASYFYDRNISTATFSKVSNITQNALSDKLVNNIQLGYSDKFKNIAISALTEINADRSYFIGNKSRSENSSVGLDLRSDIIASGYAIEFYRRLQFLRDDSGTSDRPNDYDLFIIWMNPIETTISAIENSGYNLPGESGTKIFGPGEISFGSNFIAESNGPIDRVYNVNISPVRNACRWWKILGMHTYGLPVEKAKLIFQVGQYFTRYSSRVQVEYAGDCSEIPNDVYDVINEDSNIGPDILIESEKEYIFKPIGLEFSVPQSLCSFISMANYGYGMVTVKSGNQTFLGYIQEGTNKPEDPKSGLTEFRLILAKALPDPGDYRSGDYHSGDYHTG